MNDFTPFGYLRNPAHVARSWDDTTGGNLRTSPDMLGVEWVYPVGRSPTTRCGLALQTLVSGRRCETRVDFDAIGLRCRYHTCSIVGSEWQSNGVTVEARFFLAEDDALCARVLVCNTTFEARSISLSVVGQVRGISLVPEDSVLTEMPCPHVVVGTNETELELAPGETRHQIAILARAQDTATALHRANRALQVADHAYERLLAEDEAFAATCPTLSGDWPAHWREGLHHDFQTTRLLVQPAGGIFSDTWPSWMAAWPRVVLAEGVLDMQRLAYADPVLAQRAVLTLFRDAPEANLPCVFRGGEFNMLAADGSRCGTSPAWCLPFLQLELLYLRTLDSDWLGQVFPYAAAYVRWWLANRTDPDGWLVYKCTWESGEDGNPRLDPSGSGDADISGRVRPVELQATIAHAANVLGFLAAQLGQPLDEWRSLEATYRQRTRDLFDAEHGRYRDWLIEEQRFQDSCPENPYWGVDACRYSAQSLTPLLIGEPLDEAEILRHFAPPWTLWPSWTLSLVESAAAAGLYGQVGALARDTIDRVYRVTTRRDLDSLERPMPGSSPEFWPTDWRTYGGSDAYGWGATTANLLLRHLIGFKESRETDGWVAELTPALPRELIEPNGHYGVERLNYRDLTFDLTYVAQPPNLVAELDLRPSRGELRPCIVEVESQAAWHVVHDSRGRVADRHAFEVSPGQRYRVRLR